MAEVQQGEPRGGLFGGPKPAAGAGIDVADVQSDLNAVSSRLRMSEERFGDFRRQLEFLEQQMLSNHKRVMNEVKLISGDVTEIRHEISEIRNRMVLLIKELQMTARKSDLDVVRRYVDLWEPIKFVNAEQVERLIDSKMGKDEQN